MAQQKPQEDDEWRNAVAASALNTKEEAEGRRALNPEGYYPGCTINIEKMMRSKWDWPSGDPKYQAFIQFTAPDSDVRLTKYMTITKKGDDECYTLISKAHGPDDNLVGKTLMDTNGKRVNITISHVKNKKGVEVEDWKFSRFVAAAPKPAPVK